MGKTKGIIIDEDRHEELLAYEKTIKESSEYEMVKIYTDISYTSFVITKDKLIKAKQEEINKLNDELYDIEVNLKDMSLFDRIFNWKF